MFQLADLLSPERVQCKAQAASRKRLFEIAAELLAADQPTLVGDDIYNALLARERLGSTALGDGVAIPHCRLTGCASARAALITLDTPISFDAADGRDVDLFVALLVPESGHEEHLRILAGLAGLLRTAEYRDALRRASTHQDLLAVASAS
jgi:PTS system nitrogen regulatory IIA component